MNWSPRGWTGRSWGGRHVGCPELPNGGVYLLYIGSIYLNTLRPLLYSYTDPIPEFDSVVIEVS